MKRYDTIEAPRWMTSPFEKTPEGFLRGRAVICTTGIYTYRNADGTETRELRLPEEVYAKAFLDSLRLKPLTLDHPEEMLTAENVRQFQVGNLGDNPSEPWDGSSDMYNLSIDMVIQDAEAVRAVLENRKRGLSVGYSCDLEPATPGAVWCGQPYDYIQRNLVANHVALCETPRAGDTARIRLDSADAILVPTAALAAGDNARADHGATDAAGAQVREEDGMAMKKINLDGVEYEAEAKVIEELTRAQKALSDLGPKAEKADALQAALSKAEGQRDALADEIKKLTERVKELESSRMDAAALKELLAVRDVAAKFGITLTDETDVVELKKKVILAASPKAVLDGKDAAYIAARYDAVVETMAEETSGDEAVMSVRVSATDSGFDGAAKARADMLKRMVAASRTGE